MKSQSQRIQHNVIALQVKLYGVSEMNSLLLTTALPAEIVGGVYLHS